MKFFVQMLAFQPEFCRRTVIVPDDEMNAAKTLDAKLSLIFKYGQNDFQPNSKICSVSAGDVIELSSGHSHDLYLVKANGFHKMTVAEYEDYERMERRDRSFYPLIHQHGEPKIVGYWVLSSQAGEIIKWGLNGNTVFPYSRIEDAEDQLKFLTGPTEAAGERFYLARLFDNGQMKTEEYIP